MLKNEMDVTGCSFLRCKNSCALSKIGYFDSSAKAHVSDFSIECVMNPNCHYKQLQQTKTGCKILKKCLDVKEELNEALRQDSARMKEGLEKIVKKNYFLIHSEYAGKNDFKTELSLAVQIAKQALGEDE